MESNTLISISKMLIVQCSLCESQKSDKLRPVVNNVDADREGNKNVKDKRDGVLLATWRFNALC